MVFMVVFLVGEIPGAFSRCPFLSSTFQLAKLPVASLALPSRHESTQVHRLAGVEDSTYMYRMGIKGVDL